MKRFDKLAYGAILAIVLPVLGFFAGYFFYFEFAPRTMKTYWNLLIRPGIDNSEVLTFSMLPSLFFFYFIFFHWKLDHASKGFVMVSLIYVSLIAIIKVI
jgi:hypothetical protein